MDVRFRPLDTWPRPDTKNRRGRYAFRAGWADTLNLLEHELGNLGARGVVIQAGFREGDIRLDGWPRSDARAPAHPGVIISFESRHGPLQYLTDTCEFWQHNVRSVALGLEALRAVDRYGITSRAEQYVGWKALGAGDPIAVGAAMTVEEAARLLADNAEGWDAGDLLDEFREDAHRPWIRDAYRMAAKRHHPDAGGDPDLFRRLTEARDLLLRGAA